MSDQREKTDLESESKDKKTLQDFVAETQVGDKESFLFKLKKHWGKENKEGQSGRKSAEEGRISGDGIACVTVGETESEPQGTFSENQQLSVGDELARNIDNSIITEDDESADRSDGAPIAPIDASVQVSVESTGMIAYLTVTEPLNGGENVTEEKIRLALEQAKVTFGIDDNVIHDIVEQKSDSENITIARGIAPVDGINGSVEDFFPREKKMQFTEAEDGSVDFKNLQSFTAIEKDTVICRKTESTMAQPGRDVLGNKIAGTDGIQAILPCGNNTAVSEDGTELLSLVYGCLEFDGGKFHVSNTHNVAGNVDNSVGNIDFPGDVIVSGDVCEGYSIKAQGNVIVRGSVEGASIFADGNIELANGINGMQKGFLQSKKNIKARYLENCTASARENIQTESIINSNVSCGGKLLVQGRRGAIIGGLCSVAKCIEAREIGSKVHTATSLILGITSEVLKERADVASELKMLEQEAEVITLNIGYLEIQKKDQPLTDKKAEVFNVLRRKLPINLMTQSRLRKKLDTIEQEINSAQNCTLRCAYIYPPTKISFGNIVTIVQNESQRCIYSCEKGEIICKPY